MITKDQVKGLNIIKSSERLEPPDIDDTVETCYYCHCEGDLMNYRGKRVCGDCAMDLEYERKFNN